MADITANIRSGLWPPGHRVPFETDLADQYGCARATANKAMVRLAEAGLIERRRKGGSFVARPHVQTAVLEIPDIAQVIAARGEAYAFALVSRKERRALPGPEAELRAAGTVLVLHGVHVAAGTPFAFESRIINLLAVPAARQTNFSRDAPGSWLLANVPWTQARHRITAVGADRALARRLDIRSGSPCLQVERWTWRLTEGVTYARQVFPADHYDLVAEFAPAEPTRKGPADRSICKHVG